jgi:sporulation protein YlmC with PRC-barrel domain
MNAMNSRLPSPAVPRDRLSERRAHRPLHRRWTLLVPAAVLALGLAGCVAAVPNQPDFNTGMWDGETVLPASGMLTAYQGPLIGRRVDNTAGATPLAVVATIVEPSAAHPQYVVLRGPNSPYLVIVPINALVISPSAISLTATDYTLRTLPNYPSLEAVQAQYPRTVITAVAPPPAPTASPGLLPAVLPPPVAGSPTVGGPLQFARAGSVVGLPVVDQAGTPVGQVTAVAVVPTTGEVRYAIVAGPNIGPGYYLAVPAAQAVSSQGEVVVSGTAQQWFQSTHYRGDQLPPAIGAIGVL